MRAKVGIVVTQIRCKAVDTNVFLAVRVADCNKLPLFGMHQKRLFEGARAEEFYKFQAIAFPALRASNSAR